MLKKIIIIAMVVLFVLTGVAGVAFAANDHKDENATLSQDTTHQGLYVRAANTVTINGTVNGDVWAAANTVTINGTVNGSVYAAGSEVVVKGTVQGSLHAAGSRVAVEGKVGGSVYEAGNELSLSREATVGSTMVAFGSRYSQDGSVGSQAYLFGSSVNIDGPIGGNTKIYASQITLGRGATINGDLKYVSDATISIANDGNIAGSVTKIQDPAPQASQSTVLGMIGSLLFGLASSILLGIVAISIVPGSFQAVTTWQQRNVAKSLLAGVGFAFLFPVVLLVVAVSLIGLPLALTGLFAYLAVLLLGEVVTGYCIGRWLLKRDQYNLGTLFLQLLVGLALLKVIGIIPVVGGIVGFLAALSGIGALVWRSKERLLAVRKKQLART